MSAMRTSFIFIAIVAALLTDCATPNLSPSATLAPTVTAQRFNEPTTQLPSQTVTRAPAAIAPKTFLLDTNVLVAIKNKIAAGDKTYDAALAKLLRDAESALKQGPFTVTSKTQTPPSGDKRDFQSQAPYYWLNPSSPNGLPYINRDGERNPEIDKFTDDKNMSSLISASQTLALAYYFKGDEKYAERAALLLQTWFVNPDTRMNPNMNYAQGVPGRYDGSGIGIIDSHNLPMVLDTVGLLAGSTRWDAADDRALRDWFTQYLDWLMNSKNGQQEAKEQNNHGSYYDSQVVAIALYLNRNDLATRVLEEAKTKRIALQVEPDGKQPLELRRTKSWDYSVFNLQALFRLATLGDRAGIDLWNYRTNDGRGIRAALDFLAPYAAGEKEWSYPQIVKFELGQLSPQLRQAAAVYRAASYREKYIKMSGSDAGNRLNLTLPFE